MYSISFCFWLQPLLPFCNQ